MTITILGIEFTSPILFDTWIKNVPKEKSGLYILYSRSEKDDKGNYSYYRKYIGQTEDYDDRGWNSHEGLACVKKEIGDNSVYISIHEMSNSTEDERRKLESKLLDVRKPNCNKQG